MDNHLTYDDRLDIDMYVIDVNQEKMLSLLAYFIVIHI